MSVREATVVKHTGSHYILSELPLWKTFPAVIRGKVRLKGSKATNPVAVGDRVEFELPGGDVGEENPAVITGICPRRNYVIRKSTNLSRDAHIIASNVDRAFVVVTLACPEIKLPFLDRLLVTCELYGVKATVVLNKIDLLREVLGPAAAREQVNAFRSIYERAGYDVIVASARTGEGIESLRSAMASSSQNVAGGVNLLSGVSGVGKSSIIRALDPALSPRTGEISLSHLQGRHTTTFYEMYPLHSGGYIIDTPGIRSFGLIDVALEEIPLYFPEMLSLSRSCRFTPCTHTHEPGCAVKAAVQSGEMSAERYNSYLGMLDEYKKYR